MERGRPGPVIRVLEERPHLVIPCARDKAGLTGPTQAQTRTKAWRRSSWNRYVPAAVELTTEQRILEAASLVPDGGAVTGWAALYWLGAGRWFPGRTAGVELSVWIATAARDIRRQPGIAICAERLDPVDVVVVDGIPLTSPVRSTCFEMRYAASIRRAAGVASMAAYFDLVSVDELSEYAAAHAGWTGIGQCREALPFVEENAWSPTEVDMVLAWRIDAGLPRPLCNRPVFTRSGEHIGTPDLIDVEAGVVGEYDGVVHLDADRRNRDIGAEERYRTVGLEHITMTRFDLDSTAAVIDRMLSARARAAWAPESSRLWTIEPPDGWLPTHSVALRRALTADQRRRLLRYRAA